MPDWNKNKFAQKYKQTLSTRSKALQQAKESDSAKKSMGSIKKWERRDGKSRPENETK